MRRLEPETDASVATAILAGDADGTRERILEAALAVLRDVGHGQFSVQKVARNAGVYQGNITYYWPRRRDLVLALAMRIIEDYRSTCLESLGGTDARPVQRADAVVRAMVEEAVQPDRVRILPELWSMANADPDIARAVVRSHDELLETMLEVLGVDRVGPGADDVRKVLLCVGAAIQGLTAVHGHRAADDPILAHVKDAIVTQHARLIAEVLGDVGDRAEARA